MKKKIGLIAGGVVLALALLAVDLFVGKGSVDEHKSEIASLEGTESKLEGQLEEEQTQLTTVEGEVVSAEAEVESANQATETAEESLEAERRLNGGGAKQVAAQEYNTDFPWKAAGTVGYLTIKPLSFEQRGEKYLLTLEAKNESHEPQTPFCGGAGSVVLDVEEDQYNGENVLFEGSNNCEEVGPGLTGTYEEEFKLPPNAKPVVVAIFGSYEQEEEAKTWELPR